MLCGRCAYDTAGDISSLPGRCSSLGQGWWISRAEDPVQGFYGLRSDAAAVQQGGDLGGEHLPVWRVVLLQGLAHHILEGSLVLILLVTLA